MRKLVEASLEPIPMPEIVSEIAVAYQRALQQYEHDHEPLL